MFHLNLASFKQLALSRWIAGIVLLSALQTTFMLWMSAREHAEALQTLKFRQSVTAAEEAIQHKMASYRQILKGVEQLYWSSTHVSAGEFKRFVNDYIENPEDGSLSALGFIKYLDLYRSHTLADLDMPVQQLLEKAHAVKNEHELAVLLYVEPRTGANTEQLFQNIFQNAKRRADLIESGEEGRLVMSAPRFEPPAAHRTAYILQVPVYLQAQAEPDRALRLLNGWVFLSFDVYAFLREALAPIEKRQLHFDIVDMASGEGHAVLYMTEALSKTTPKHPADYLASHTLNVNGQVWNIRVRSSTEFDSGIDYSEANRLGVMGVFLSLLLSTLIYFTVMRNRTQIVLEKFNQELNTTEQRWKFALESTGDGLWDWYVAESKVLYSDRWKRMLGFAPHQLDDSPSSWHARIHPEEATGVMSVVEALLRGERQEFSLEYRIKCRDGSWKWVMDRGVVFKRDDDGLPLRILGMLTDITKIKQSEETVWQYANVDTLTGLLNRRRFFIKLDQALTDAKQYNHKLAIIFMDLDRFKEVNDTLGHAQGDKLLQDAGQRLQGCVGQSDLVSRLGGDEFVIMLSDADARYVEDIAQKVLYQLSYPFHLDHTHAYISASLGISIFPDDADNKDDLMKRVDQAMYASKHKGGNCFTYFTPRMQAQAEHKMQLSNDLRQAISDEQFFLEYQPVVNLKTQTVAKAEALVRWQHPLKGIIPPVEFISIAEDNLLIIPIGQWVFETAIEQCSHWRKTLQPEFQIAINKSPVQFASEHRKHHDWLFKMVQNNLHKGMVVVEITERLLMEANPQVSERLAQYRQAGVQVALDDFGTGYSSLSYLKKFPIDYVKIDRAFVRELGVSHEDQALCQAIIVMAHTLGMQVIAEGIESQHQLDLLCKMGCDFGQGYYFSPPLRPEAFEDWCRQWGRQSKTTFSKQLSS